jgi:hypothetical protein
MNAYVARLLRQRGYITRQETRGRACYRLGARIWDLRHNYKWRIACAEKKINGVYDFVYTLEKIGKPV